RTASQQLENRFVEPPPKQHGIRAALMANHAPHPWRRSAGPVTARQPKRVTASPRSPSVQGPFLPMGATPRGTKNKVHFVTYIAERDVVPACCGCFRAFRSEMRWRVFI